MSGVMTKVQDRRTEMCAFSCDSKAWQGAALIICIAGSSCHQSDARLHPEPVHHS